MATMLTFRRLGATAAMALLCAACDSGRDALLSGLRSANPFERAAALRKLGDDARHEDFPLLVRASEDESPLVRAEAAIALGKTNDERALDPLGQLLADGNDSVATRAAVALAPFKTEKSRAYLTFQYARRDALQRHAIAHALQTSGLEHPLDMLVSAEAKLIWDKNLRALEGGTLPERVGAAEELGRSGRPEAIDKLLPLVEDTHVVLASAAVRGLGHAGNPKAAGRIALTLTENFPELRDAGTFALLKLSDERAYGVLKTLVLEGGAASARASDALAQAPRTPETDRLLCDIAFSGPADLAASAGQRMRARGGCPLEPALRALSAKRDVAALMRGLTFVSALGPNAKATASKVTPLLSHKDADVRAAAAVALGEMGEERAIAELKRVYLQRAALLRQGRAKWMPPEPAPLGAGQSSGKLKTLMSRVESLQRAKAEGSGKILLSPMPPSELANDVSPQESQAFADILEALGKRSSPEAADELKKWAVDESPSIRAAAYVSLAAMGEAGAAVAKEGLFDSDRFVQSRVAEALAAQGEKGQAALLDAIAKLPGDRVRFLEALYNAGATPAAAFALTELLSEGGAEVAFAASMLGQLRAEPARTPLVRYLADAAAPSRVSVIWALGELGGAEAEAAVVKELYSDNPDVRTAAATALGRMKSTAGSAMLNALKGDYYLDVRNAAEAALAQL